MQYTPAEPQQTAAPAGISSALSGNRKLIVIAMIALAAFGYFGFTAFQSATSFYLTVDELVAEGPGDGIQSLQVKGRLVEESFLRESTANTVATFELHENGATINAMYDGVLPDLFFNPHSEIVLGGTYSPEGMFVADRVLVKCPSKYQALEVDNPYAEYPEV